MTMEGDTTMNDQIEIEETTVEFGEDEIQDILSRETPEAKAEYVAEFNEWFDKNFGGK